MLVTTESISTTMYDLLKPKRNTKIVMTGVAVTLLWVVLGWLFWPLLYGVSSYIMELLPFKMLKSDGAYIFISMVWLLGTLVTFSFLVMFFGGFFTRNVKEKSSNRLLPLVVAGISFVWTLIIYFGFDKFYATFTHILTTLPFNFTEESVAAVMSVYLLYNGLIVTMAALSSMRSKYVLEELRIEQYPDKQLIGSAGNTFKSTFKNIMIFSVASLVSFPLLFIPVLNILVQFSLWVWLYRDMFSRDVCELYCNEQDKEGAKSHKWAFWTISSVSSVMSFLPFINFFAPYFAEMTMFHLVMKTKDE